MAISAYRYNAFVTRVIDGDTVIMDVDLGFRAWVHDQSFRLLGINAAEKNTAAGKAAMENLMKILPVGAAVTLDSVKDDKYGGRYDAIITLSDGTDLAKRLIDGGFAVPWGGTGTKPVPS